MNEKAARIYDIDKATGFMTAKNPDKAWLTVQQKLDFLKAFTETANFTEAAKMAGVSAHTFRSHMHVDPVFYKRYREAVDTICDNMEASLYKMGKHNVTAAFGILRAFRPNIWNEKRIIAAEGGGTKVDRLKGVLDQLKVEGALIDLKEEGDGSNGEA
jgi:hypothetical protein